MKVFAALLLIFAALLAVSAQDVLDILSDSESLTEASLKAGDTACLKAGLNLRWSPCGNVVATKSKGGERVKVLDARNVPGCNLKAYSWVMVELSGGGKVWGAMDTGLISQCGSAPAPVPVPPPSNGGADSNKNQAGNPGFQYDYATRCTGGPAPGAVQLQSWLGRRFPQGRSGGIYNCRTVRGGSNTSLHGEGRAVDWMLNVNNAAQRAAGDAIRNFFLANGAAKAREFGVQEVIWNRQIWTKSGGLRAYNGENPHTDHVHIGMNRWGAQNLRL